MLELLINVNGVQIGRLRCVNVEGPDDGRCKYRCTYLDHDSEFTHQFEVIHWRPSGAAALAAAAMALVAEAGVGRRDGGKL